MKYIDAALRTALREVVRSSVEICDRFWPILRLGTAYSRKPRGADLVMSTLLSATNCPAKATVKPKGRGRPRYACGRCVNIERRSGCVGSDGFRGGCQDALSDLVEGKLKDAFAPGTGPWAA